LVVFSAIWFTKDCLAAGAFSEIADGQTRLDAIMPDPQWGRLLSDADWDNLDRSGTVAAAVVRAWVMLLIAVLPAFAVSYYFNAQTWVYLLLRRFADQVEFDEVYIEQDAEDPATVEDKVEPAKPAKPAKPAESTES
jgi:hypothetical protein